MRTLLSEWTFHKAGQGCFYTGLINAHGRDKFCFVFDCGSTKGAGVLREEIKEFKQFLAGHHKKEIDVLVLSHYDADHVNQLPSLLKETKCKIAILPYLTNEERISIYFSQAISDGTDDDDYFSFITDPAGYLTNLNVDRIIFIDGNDEESDANINPGGPPTGFRYDHLSNEDKPRQSITDVSLRPIVMFKPTGFHNDPEKMEFMQHAGTKAELAKGHGTIRSGIYWEFFFHQKPQSPRMIWRFREKLKEIFKLNLAGDYVTYQDLRQMTINAKARAKLKKAHIDFFGDINETGLVVMHGPLGQRHTESFRKTPLYSGKYCSTILNGDCNLNTINYPAYIAGALPWTRFFQVPHHGSTHSWYEWFDLNDLGLSQMVVNYGTNNKYKHPHQDVVEWIEANYPFWQLKRNTEKKKYSYHITSYI